MATVSGNVITSGLRGKIGELLVFRVLRGKTVVSRAALKPDKSKETAAQRATRTMFREASQWARVALMDPERRQYYQQRA